ncbi:hypothetical protein ACTNDY_11480 [Tissierellaceae bacterium HCP3S3_D8]
MKRFVSFLLVLTLLTTIVVGCGKPADEGTSTPPEAQTPETEGTEEPSTEAGKITKLGLGQNISIAKSADAEGDKTALGQADVTIAAVGFDADGKVASVTIDVAQTKIPFDKEMKVTVNRDEEVKSKKELKDDYGMKKHSEIEKEWYEQMEAFEEWMIGKTVDEITGLKVKERDESHPAVPDIPELTSTVTISVENYIAAVDEAWEKAVDVEGAETVGLGLKTSIASSKDLEVDKDGKEVLPLAQADTTMTATAFDADGKVVGTIIDVAQVKIEFDKDGKVTTDKTAELKTKHELKYDYNMKETSEKIGIGKEWFEQMEEFQNWMVGKTVDEITGLKVKERDEKHKSVPDIPELTSTVTMTVESYLEVVQRAFDNKR